MTIRRVDLYEIDDAWLRAAASDAELEAVTELRFWGAPRSVRLMDPEAWAGFWTSPVLRNVRRVVLKGAAVTLGPDVLSAPDFLPAVESLELNTQHVKHFTGRHSYEEPEIGYGLPARSFAMIAAHENGLIEVREPLAALLRWQNLEANTHDDATIDALLASPHWPEVQALALGRWCSPAAARRIVEHLAVAGALSELILLETIGRDAARAALEAAARSATLKTLEIQAALGPEIGVGIQAFAANATATLEAYRSDYTMTEALAEALSGSPAFRQLRELDVDVECLYERHVFKKLKLPSVRVLRVDRRKDRLTDSDVTSLLASKTAQDIEVLGLSWQKRIGNPGARTIAKSRSLTRLKKLDLGYSGIKKAGAAALGKSETLPAKIARKWSRKAVKMKG